MEQLLDRRHCVFETFGIFEPDLLKVHPALSCSRCVWAVSLLTHLLWRPLQITSRRCRPALCSPVYSLSWESSCSWLSSSPSAKERGSPSLVSSRPSPVSIRLVRRQFRSIHFGPCWCPLSLLLFLLSRPVHHDRSLHLYRPLPPEWESGLVWPLLHPGVDFLRAHLHLLHHLLCATQEDGMKRTVDIAQPALKNVWLDLLSQLKPPPWY